MTFWDDIFFANVGCLWLLALLPCVAVWKYLQRKNSRHSAFKISGLAVTLPRTWRIKAQAWVPFALRLAAAACLIFAMARPQKMLQEENIKAEGIDIMLVMDLSSSMLAQDFKPDRLSVSKEMAVEFVKKRRFDRIGLVVFSGEAFTQCPLTTDHQVLTDFLKNLQCGMLEDGTAIGMGLATGVNRLKDSDSKSKILILLTDGVNNAGYIRPEAAAEIAKNFGLKIYTIGTGSVGTALTPIGRRRNDGVYIFGMAEVEIDEPLLTRIAAETGGKYFRATSKKELENIYSEIDALEKTKIETTSFRRYSEKFRPFLFAAFLFLGLEFVLKNIFLKKMID